MLTETHHQSVLVMMDSSTPMIQIIVKLVVSDVLNVLTQPITVLNVMETEKLPQIVYAHLDIMNKIQYLLVKHAHLNVLNVPQKMFAQYVSMDTTLTEQIVLKLVVELNTETPLIIHVIHVMKPVLFVPQETLTTVIIVQPDISYMTMNVCLSAQLDTMVLTESATIVTQLVLNAMDITLMNALNVMKDGTFTEMNVLLHAHKDIMEMMKPENVMFVTIPVKHVPELPLKIVIVVNTYITLTDNASTNAQQDTLETR